MNSPFQIATSQSIQMMDSKEIASLTGKEHAHVLRDIRAMISQVHDIKDNPNMDYLDIQGVTVERDSHTKRTSRILLDKDYTLTLLTGYDAKARFKVMQRWQELESIRAPMSPAELIIAQGQALLAVEQQQTRQAQQITALEHRVDMMDGDTGYQTVTAYIRKHGWRVPLSQAKAIGLNAAKLAKELGIQIGVVPDERWGTVNSYPIALLDDVVAEFFDRDNRAQPAA